MNILQPKSIEDYIIAFLQKGESSGPELLKKIQEKRPKTTKQALYAALRKLRAAEIVITYRMKISLSQVWIDSISTFFQKAQYFNTEKTTIDGGFLHLEDGDRITYLFKNPNSTDIFWGHLFQILAETTSPSEPIYIYNPHQWFLLARRESEVQLFQKIIEGGRQIFTLGGGLDFLDTYVRKEFDGEMSQYHATDENLFKKRNYYLNIFNDFIIEVSLSEDTTKEINDFYQKTKTWGEVEKIALQKIIADEGKNELIISRNKKRADVLKKTFKPFFFQKNKTI